MGHEKQKLEDPVLAQSVAAMQTVTPKPKKQYTKEKIPENRKAVGRYIKGLILDTELTIVQFAAENEIVEHKSALDRVISGRKIIDQEFAPILTRVFGGNDDFWITLQNKILAEPDIIMPNFVAPKQSTDKKRRFMGSAADDFSGANEDQVAEASGDFIVCGTGKGRVLIPKDLPPELISDIFAQWLDRAHDNQPQPAPER